MYIYKNEFILVLVSPFQHLMSSSSLSPSPVCKFPSYYEKPSSHYPQFFASLINVAHLSASCPGRLLCPPPLHIARAALIYWSHTHCCHGLGTGPLHVYVYDTPPLGTLFLLTNHPPWTSTPLSLTRKEKEGDMGWTEDLIIFYY